MNNIMIKNFIIVILFILISSFSFLFSQTEYTPIELKTGTNYIFGDDVNIRKEPDINSVIISKLSIGKEIEIIKNTNLIYKEGNIKDYWYKVKSDNIIGYVWGSYLSSLYINADIDDEYGDDMLLIRNIATSPYFENNQENPHRYEIRLIKNNELAFEYVKKEQAGLNFFGYNIYNNTGLSPDVKLIELIYDFESDIWGTGSDFYYIVNNKIYFAFSFEYEYAESDVHCKCELIFPDDNKGQENKIIIVKSCKDWLGDENLDYYEHVNTTVYNWDGKTFNKES